MAACIAIEECEHSFTSPCSQVGCLHTSSTVEIDYNKHKRGNNVETDPSTHDPSTASSPECKRCQYRDPLPQGITSSDTSLPTHDCTTAFSSNFKPYEIPDPLSKCPAATSSTPEEDAKHPTKGNSDEKPWERESDNYVMMKSYLPTYDKNSNFKIITTEKPILITDLRPSEQIIAYDAILFRAPAGKIPEYYTLHLSRLVVIQEAIASEEKSIEELSAELAEWRKKEVGIMTELSERKRAEEAFGALQRAFRCRARFRAWERGWVRLVERCEKILELEEGFEPVEWRKRA